MPQNDHRPLDDKLDELRRLQEDMLQRVTDQLEEAALALLERDTDRANAVRVSDDEIDALCERASETVVRDLIERELEETDEEDVEQLLQDVSRLLLTVRDLERVGDHAVNICARTLYMVENDDELIY